MESDEFLFNETLKISSIDLLDINSYELYDLSEMLNLQYLVPYVLALGVLTAQNLTTSKIREEITGPFRTVFKWKSVDYEYPNDLAKRDAIEKNEFIPENNLPLGIEIWKDKIFVSMPKWKNGIPATVTYIPRSSTNMSPKFIPYPNWNWYQNSGILCSNMISVFRMQIDSCNRLWILDSGIIDISIEPKSICPPKLLIFNLNTDELLLRYELPENIIKQDSLLTNIVVDVRDQCEAAFAYIADVWRYGLIVFSLKDLRTWRITHHLFYPDPLASAFKVNGLEFQWTDGIFGLALTPYDSETHDRLLVFHPMSNFREYYVKTSIIQNETGWNIMTSEFKILGQSRGLNGQSSASAIDGNGVLFFNLVSRNAIGCWDTKKAYCRKYLAILANNNEVLNFPNDMKIEQNQSSVWVITNKLPEFLYRKLDMTLYNFRIINTNTKEAVKNTICDPDFQIPRTEMEQCAE